MALSANTVWEVETGGSDTNGGGFVTGASGVDWSQASSPQYSVIDGVTAGTTTITSATASFGTDVVGNLIYVSGGTGSITAGWYQIVTRTNSTTITVDRTTGLSVGTGATLHIGGALLTPQQAFTNMVAGNSVFIKGGTYNIGTGLTMTTNSSTQTMHVTGYTSIRGDFGRATLKATAAITLLTANQAGWSFENLILDGNTATGTNGINSTQVVKFVNCLIKNFSGYGVQVSTQVANLIGVEVFGCGTTAGLNATVTVALDRCYIHDNTVPGINTTAIIYINRCLVTGNSGANSDGLLMTGTNIYGAIWNSVFVGNGRDGARIANNQSTTRGFIVENCIFSVNTGTGLNFSTNSPATQTIPEISNNAYYNNGTARAGFAAEAGAVTLSGDPFVASGSGNYALNTTAGAGAACRAAGIPGAFPGGLTTGYIDIGAAQHQDPAGGLVIIIEDE